MSIQLHDRYVSRDANVNPATQAGSGRDDANAPPVSVHTLVNTAGGVRGQKGDTPTPCTGVRTKPSEHEPAALRSRFTDETGWFCLFAFFFFPPKFRHTLKISN